MLRLLSVVLVLIVPATASADKPAKATLGAVAPAFDLPVVQGEGSGELSAHYGRVVVLKFWATYCGWCKSIRPALVKFADKNTDIAVLAISSQGTGKLNRYLRKKTIGVPVLHDKRAKVARLYRSNATPTLMVIDQCGVLRFRQSGTRAAKKAMKLAKELDSAETACKPAKGD